VASEENAVVAACLCYLQTVRGWPAWRQNQGAVPLKGGGYRSFNGLKGVSDIIAVIPPHGRFLGVECKSPTGRLSESQKNFGDLVAGAGAVYLVVRNVGELIDGLGRLETGLDAAGRPS
jgi:hypothetical protein